MRAGKLRTKCLFQQEVKTPDGGGGYDLAWGDDRVVFCEFHAESGRENLKSGRVESSIRAMLSARAKSVPFLTAGWRVTINGVVWNVRSVAPFGQRGDRTDIVIESGGVAV